MPLAILECVPKGDGRQEGQMLSGFLRMGGPEVASLFTFSTRGDLTAFLEDGAGLQGYSHVHLSGHGRARGVGVPYFKLPRGRMFAEDFPEGCFAGKAVALSACELGRRRFIDPFKRQTGARVVVAPQREVLFLDAAVWFVHYYYFLLQHGTMDVTAFERTEASLRPYVRGAFRYM